MPFKSYPILFQEKGYFVVVQWLRVHLSLKMVTAAMKLKDACSLEEKL